MKRLILPLLILTLSTLLAAPLKSFGQIEIKLNGNPSAKTCVHAQYTDAGYTILSGSPTSITMEGTFKNTDETGFFSFRYKAQDAAGNIFYSDTRYVLVENGASCQSGIESANGIKKLVHLYPNPSNNEITIQWVGVSSKFFSYTISDMTGRIIDVSPYINISSNTYQLSTANIPNGMYLLNIQSSEGISVEKIQIAH